MKNLGFLFLAASLIVATTSCKNNTIKKGSGHQAQIGNIATFNFTVKKDTGIVFSSGARPQVPQEILTDPKGIKDPFQLFITQCLLSMHQGDSTNFAWKAIDTMKVKPRGFETAKSVIISIGLVDVKNEKDFLATLAPDQQKQFLSQKKSMAIQERLEPLQAKIQAVGEGLVAASATFVGRAKSVGDSTNLAAKQFASGKLPANVQTTASGLKYVILKEGTGKLPADGDLAFVHYYGVTKEGKKFDESFTKGQPFAFPVGIGQVIPAWDEALKLAKEGSTMEIFVPSALGYGPQASKAFGPNTDLVFYIEVLKAI